MSRLALVVGGGFIGRAVAKALVVSGRSVSLLSRRQVEVSAGAISINGDLTDLELLESLIGPETDVVYAAGPSVPSAVEQDPSQFAEPLAGLVVTLEALRRQRGCSLMLVSSGGTVYGEPNRQPVPEDHPLRPLSAYGAAMVRAESYVRFVAERHGINATSLRCANVFGPGQAPGNGQGLVATVLDAAINDRIVQIWGDGSVVRDFVYIDDLTGVVTALLGRTDLGTALNVGSGAGTTVAETVRLVGEITGWEPRCEWRPPRSLDVRKIVLDVSRLHSLVPYVPVPLADGIAKTWAALCCTVT